MTCHGFSPEFRRSDCACSVPSRFTMAKGGWFYKAEMWLDFAALNSVYVTYEHASKADIPGQRAQYPATQAFEAPLTRGGQKNGTTRVVLIWPTRPPPPMRRPASPVCHHAERIFPCSAHVASSPIVDAGSVPPCRSTDRRPFFPP